MQQEVHKPLTATSGDTQDQEQANLKILSGTGATDANLAHIKQVRISGGLGLKMNHLARIKYAIRCVRRERRNFGCKAIDPSFSAVGILRSWMPSVVECAAHRVLRDVEPGRAARESEVDHLHADAVRDRLAERAVGVVED